MRWGGWVARVRTVVYRFAANGHIRPTDAIAPVGPLRGDEVNRDTAANRLDSSSEAPSPQRRRFLGWLSGVGMVAGLVAAYGTLGGFLARFLYPARPTERGWMFVAELGSLRQGDSLLYRTPAGAPINITRRERGDSVDSFVALSSTCPHLGCQVTWEPQNNRFFDSGPKTGYAN